MNYFLKHLKPKGRMTKKLIKMRQLHAEKSNNCTKQGLVSQYKLKTFMDNGKAKTE